MHLKICFLLLLNAALVLGNDLIITEIYHSPSNKKERLEFVELYNKSSQPISLFKWEMSKGIDYKFPKGITIAGKSYLIVAKNPTALRTAFSLADSVQILGPFKGRLDGNGETLVLRNSRRQEVDRVHYKEQDTWAVCVGEKDHSLQLVNPTFDNRIGTHWEVASPSPCQVNLLVFTKQRLPIIKHVRQYPKAPQSNRNVHIQANVRNASQVELWYQIVKPGHYIALADSAYQKNWTKLDMLDDGKNGDAAMNDRIYTLQIPKELQQHRQLVRYKIIARGDSTSVLPRSSNPQPNFAYYTYDSLPDYKDYSFKPLKELPVCQLIAKAEDVQYLIYEYEKRHYKRTGTLVYNGEVYDHIGYRSRGYKNRHSRTKRNLKFNLHKNKPIKVVNNEGKDYATKRDKLVLSGGWLLDQPNFHGLAESVLYRLFSLQGASASYADYVHLRVVEHENESDSLKGDFWGLYLTLENYDGDFLKTHDLPAANIYSYKPFKLRYACKTNTALQQQAYNNWDTSYCHTQPLDWWTKTLDWEHYMGFLIGNELVGNRETGYRKQHWWTEYRHPQNGWQFFPWDVDKTWSSSRGKSTISYSIYTKVFEHKVLEQAYQNQLRSVLDLLFNEEQAFQLIDESAQFIYEPQKDYSFVDLDKLRWGHAYDGSFEGQVRYLKKFVQKRRAYILKHLLEDTIPKTPTIRYTGAANFPIEALTFEGKQLDFKTTRAIEWHLAEISDTNNPFYAKTDPKIYEIAPIWKREDLRPSAAKLTLPFGAIKPGRTYRIRLRVKDTTGYYSHWSTPVQFIPKAPKKDYGLGLVINELLLDSKDDLEFIELYNPTDQAINLTNFKFESGIKFQFPSQASLAANDYWVLTNKPKLFKKKYGFAADGIYQGKLSNEGEQLILLNAFDCLIDSLSYAPHWKGESQGEGLSLELIQVEGDNALSVNWAVSTNLLGTPGMLNTSLAQAELRSQWYLAFCLVALCCFAVYYQTKRKRNELV